MAHTRSRKYRKLIVKKLDEKMVFGTEDYKFPSVPVLDDFLNRAYGYTVNRIKSNHGFLRAKNGVYYAIVSVNGQPWISQEEAKEYFKRKLKFKSATAIMPKKKKTDRKKQRAKVRYILDLINAKYGRNLVKAEGTPEFKELQHLLGVN